MNTHPNYTDFGLSSPMSSEVRQLVEEQLTEDLKHYGIQQERLKFDWSDSCIEGHDTQYLDSWVENYSDIALYDEWDHLAAEGWMEFVHEGAFFLAYWEYLTTWNQDQQNPIKEHPGIPDHIWAKIPDNLKWNYESQRLPVT